MLYESIKKVRICQAHRNIIFFSWAVNDTLVIVYKSENLTSHLAHVTTQGQILFEKLIEDGSICCGMITDSEMVIVEGSRNRVMCVDLNKQSWFYFQHQMVFSESDDKQIQIFSQTKILCIKQSGSHDSNKFRLTYYSYPFNIKTKSQEVYDSKQMEWSSQHKLSKGDNQSLLIWFKRKQQNYIEFQTFHLDPYLKGVFTSYKIEGQGFDQMKGHSKIFLSNIWKSNSQQFLVIYTSQTNYNEIARHRILKISIKENKLQNLTEDLQENSYIKQSINLGQFTIIDYSVLRKQQSLFENKSLYIDNQTYKMIQINNFAQILVQSLPLSYDNAMLMTVIADNHQDLNFHIRFIKIMRTQQVMLHFMLKIYEDFDDDILQDALELLDMI